MIGFIITILCFYFIGRTLLEYKIDLSLLLNAAFLIYFPLALLVYTLLVALNVLSWKWVLDFFSDEKINYKTTFIVYSKSNIAKYLPTNTMHFVARNIIGNRQGWKHTNIALSSVIETAVILITGGLLAIVFRYSDSVALLKGFLYKEDHKIQFYMLFGLVLLLAVLIAIWGFKRKKGSSNKLKLFSTKEFLFLFFRMFIVYSFQFVVLGFLLFVILSMYGNMSFSYDILFNVVSIYIFGWIAGFIVPGSPGGIGVREAVLLLLLNPFFGEQAVSLSIIVHRILSILGDCLVYFVGLFFKNRR